MSKRRSGHDCLLAADRDKPNLTFSTCDARDGWLGDRAGPAPLLRERTAMCSVRERHRFEQAHDGERLHDDYLMKPIDFDSCQDDPRLLNIEWSTTRRTSLPPRPQHPSTTAVAR